MPSTPRLSMPYLASNQADGEINHNLSLNIVDALMNCRVVDRDLSAPPAAAEGDVYIVAGSPTGAWSGKAGKLAIWYNSQWAFITPKEGFEVWIEDEQVKLRYAGASWIYAEFGRVPQFGRLGRRRYSMKTDRGANTRSVVNAALATPAGTLGNTADEAGGPFQTWTTTASSGNVAGNSIFTTGSTGSNVQLRWKPIVAFHIKTPSDISSIRLMVGLAASSPGSSDTPAVQSILLRYSTAVPDSAWVTYLYNGSSSSGVGAAIAADTDYLIVLKAVTGSIVEVWMGTTWETLTMVRRITSGLPSDSTDLYAWISCTTLVAATRQIKVSCVEVEHD